MLRRGSSIDFRIIAQAFGPRREIAALKTVTENPNHTDIADHALAGVYVALVAIVTTEMEGEGKRPWIAGRITAGEQSRVGSDVVEAAGIVPSHGIADVDGQVRGIEDKALRIDGVFRRSYGQRQAEDQGEEG